MREFELWCEHYAALCRKELVPVVHELYNFGVAIFFIVFTEACGGIEIVHKLLSCAHVYIVDFASSARAFPVVDAERWDAVVTLIIISLGTKHLQSIFIKSGGRAFEHHCELADFICNVFHNTTAGNDLVAIETLL